MSKIKAKVKEILCEENLNIVIFETNEIYLKMVSLELENIKTGDEVLLHVNPSHVALSRESLKNSSFDNVISSKVVKIDRGKLLSTVKVELSNGIFLNSLLTTQSFDRLNLHENEEIFLLINVSEISISKRL